jgi:drug/metabolite transporter (DMT)-like permease
MTQNTTGAAALSPTVGTARSPSATSIGAMLLLAIMWGLSIPVTKLGLETTPPLTLTALRFAVAVPLLFVLSISQRLPMHALEQFR